MDFYMKNAIPDFKLKTNPGFADDQGSDPRQKVGMIPQKLPYEI